jgi:TatA/E family protein of Tat protein translocase
MFRNIGWPEILLILAIVMVLFGATKLPQMAHSLGKSLTSFKKGLKDTADDVKDALKEEAAAEGGTAPSTDSDETPSGGQEETPAVEQKKS